MKLTKKKIKCNVFENLCSDLGLSHYDLCEYPPKGNDVEITLEKLPPALLMKMSNAHTIDTTLRHEAMKVLNTFKFTPEIFDQQVSSLEELEVALHLIFNVEKPLLKIQLGKHKYPIKIARLSLQHSFFGSYVWMTASYCVCDFSSERRWSIRRDHLVDPITNKYRTLREVLSNLKIFEFTEEDAAAYDKKVSKANTLFNKVGTVIDVHGLVLIQDSSFWGSGLLEMQLGNHGRSCQGIIENVAETQNTDDEDDRADSAEWPFVRVFSLDLKSYVYVDVDDFTEHEFNREMRNKLVLPEEMKQVLYSVFDANETFKDIFSDRNGGMVILTNGPSGVGKTLTAEVFAEYAGRPLYVMEMGELGTNLDSVEENLQKIFHRAGRWNAVLLFDEADIFMAKRVETDLERSAIVGVFLRLLDRYQGMFFLTTNRAEVIDPAFQSRVTLALEYPSLTHTTRAKIWGHMLEAAGFDCDPSVIDAVSEAHDINGRQIRNQVRLLRVLFPKEKVLSRDMFEKSLKYVARAYFADKPAAEPQHSKGNGKLKQNEFVS